MTFRSTGILALAGLIMAISAGSAFAAGLDGGNYATDSLFCGENVQVDSQSNAVTLTAMLNPNLPDFVNCGDVGSKISFQCNADDTSCLLSNDAGPCELKILSPTSFSQECWGLDGQSQGIAVYTRMGS